MITEDVKENQNRPYGPPSDVTILLSRLRSRNLPEQIDTEYLRDAGISEGTIGRTLFALRFLGLIDGGIPTEALKSIHTSTDEEYRGILSGLVREAYSEVFNVVDPTEDGQDKILNVFRRYLPASQRSRMVVFFLGMCREAGIPTLNVPRARGKTAGPLKEVRQKSTSQKVASSSARARDSVRHTASTIDPSLEGLVRALPLPGEPLSEERRRQWLEMAEATLKFVYPETATPVMDGDIPTTKDEE